MPPNPTTTVNPDPAPMHCTAYVDGDPAGCARCGERRDLHDPDDIVLSDVARERLTGLLDLHDRASRLARDLDADAADLDQLTAAFRQRDIAERTSMRFHFYAAGVAGAAGVPRGDEVVAVTRIRRQLEEARS